MSTFLKECLFIMHKRKWKIVITISDRHFYNFPDRLTIRQYLLVYLFYLYFYRQYFPTKSCKSTYAFLRSKTIHLDLDKSCVIKKFVKLQFAASRLINSTALMSSLDYESMTPKWNIQFHPVALIRSQLYYKLPHYGSFIPVWFSKFEFPAQIINQL